MGRELKFRVWDNDREVMITEDDEIVINFCAGKCSVHYEREKNIVREGIEMDVPVWDECDDFELMQSTGLLDKNNNPIYEGDVVMANGTESVLDYDFSQARKYVSATIQDSRHFEKRRSNYKVYWQDNFLQFSFMSLSKPKHSINGDVNERDIEVIGNIYQHPELINP